MMRCYAPFLNFKDMYLIKFEKTVQISPDDWRVEWQEKLFDEKATIDDIHNWIMKNYKMQDKKNTIFPDVRISRPE